jgi:hypothetical protein
VKGRTTPWLAKSRRILAEMRPLVFARDGHICQRCGRVSCRPIVFQHRDPRGMGGTRNLDAHALSVGITMGDPCHRFVETKERGKATEEGWFVRSGLDPEQVPVRTFRGWVLLKNDGTKQAWNPGPPDAEEAS